MAKTIEELQKEYDDYKVAQEQAIKEKDTKISTLEAKAHDLEIKVATLNELRLQQNTRGKNKGLLEDIE